MKKKNTESDSELVVPGSFMAISDVHIGCKLFNFPELEKDIRSSLTYVVDMAIAKKCQYFIVAGDLYDNNRPTADQVSFVSGEVTRLKRAGVTPLAIAGDHDKPQAGKSWALHANGFNPISSAYGMIGIDYSDDPAAVLRELQLALDSGTAVAWVFLHGQVPELWPFCDEKKTLSLKSLNWLNQCSTLKGVLLGDIHKPIETTLFDPGCGRPVYTGYCGSLGVTRLDEVVKEGVYYYDGKTALSRLTYPLPRKYFRFGVSALLDGENSFKASIETELTDGLEKPVVVIDYTSDEKDRLCEFAYMYDIALVRLNRLAATTNSSAANTAGIRSTLSNADRIASALSDTLSDVKLEALAHQLLTSEKIESVLDEVKAQMLGTL